MYAVHGTEVSNPESGGPTIQVEIQSAADNQVLRVRGQTLSPEPVPTMTAVPSSEIGNEQSAPL